MFKALCQNMNWHLLRSNQDIIRRLKFPDGPKMTTIEARWDGPYSWPTYETKNTLPPIPKIPGVYLQTFEYQDGYLIYAAGLTRRPAPNRFREHTQKYMNGDYTVLDITAVQEGIRKEIWHGWGYARENRNKFEEQKSVILDAVHKQLEGFRIFVVNVGTEPRILERIEASVMNNLYQQPTPICTIPDKGMQLAPRRDSEEIITIKNDCSAFLHGLPTFLRI